MTFAGCASLQGAFLNPISEIDGNACFYLLGILIYCLILVESCYLSRKDIKNIWKFRVLLKASLLSFAHLNPVFLVFIAIFLDISIAILEYNLVKSAPKFSNIILHPKLWLVDNILCNIALGLLLFLPGILLSITLTSILVCWLVCSSMYVHYR